uniref:FAD-dependent oxidoreductase 2 FAD binding domain-containing protein n=1 Tax=Panagrolaimus sp. ES5 TaxID=591445 RepID=A0AC34G785_9BILA
MDHQSDNAENVPPTPMTSTKLFEHFVQANTLKQIQSIFYQICITEGIDTTDFSNIYPLLRKIDEGKSNSKAEKLWTFLDKRRNFVEYGRQKICKDMNVLIIGAGPCGLRAGIEAALLGAKVIIVEQRDKFSRNN